MQIRLEQHFNAIVKSNTKTFYKPFKAHIFFKTETFQRNSAPRTVQGEMCGGVRGRGKNQQQQQQNRTPEKKRDSQSRGQWHKEIHEKPNASPKIYGIQFWFCQSNGTFKLFVSRRGITHVINKKKKAHTTKEMGKMCGKMQRKQTEGKKCAEQQQNDKESGEKKDANYHN